MPVKKRDLNRKGLVKRGKNFRRPSWEQAEIETKRKRPSSSRSFDEQLELERYAEEDDLGDPASPIANHLSQSDVRRGQGGAGAYVGVLCLNHTHVYAYTIYFNVARRPGSTTPPRHRGAPRAYTSTRRTYTIHRTKISTRVCGASRTWTSRSRNRCDPSSPSPRNYLRPTPSSLSQSSMGWVILYKTVGQGPDQAVGLLQVLKWPVTQKKTFEKPPMLTKSLTKRTLARRSLQLDQGHGDLLIVRCVAPPGTLQEYANFAHSNLQMPSANTLPKCTVEVEVSGPMIYHKQTYWASPTPSSRSIAGAKKSEERRRSGRRSIQNGTASSSSSVMVLTQRVFHAFPNFNFASMASTRCYATLTPSTWPSESLRVAS